MVEKDGEYVGIFTKKDVLKKVAGKSDPRMISVNFVMSSPLLSMDINTSVGKACLFLKDKGIKHLAVTDAGKVVGVLSVKDLVPASVVNSAKDTKDLLKKAAEYGEEEIKKAGKK